MRTVFSAVVIGFAVISFWRGIWGLMDLYLFPNNYELSLWVSVLMGVVILYFTKHLIDELI
ncbi:MAG TPA: hypothetical protein ENH99_02560 [Candidatus Pacearchaeota archaeon]|nr:hypothetical protein [Candidatus Pacearchaeota archaeon]